MKVEIMAVANGWVVMPARGYHDGYPVDVKEMFVFNNAEALAGHIEVWAGRERDTLDDKCKQCRCKTG